jgi:hypothetical protein
VVAAYSTEDSTYWLLNPGSGDYRQVPATIATVSPDLRYAILKPGAVVDTRTGATRGHLNLGEDWDVDWSADGRWLALTHRTGSYATDIWLDELQLLDLVGGRDVAVSLPDRNPYPPDWVIGWLDGRYLLATPAPLYASIGPDGHIEVNHSPAPLIGGAMRPTLEPHLTRLEQNNTSDAVYYDLRTHAMSRVPDAQLPANDKPLPGLPQGVMPLGALDRYHVLVAANEVLQLWDIRDGTRHDAGQLSAPPLSAIVQPAAGLSARAADRRRVGVPTP